MFFSTFWLCFNVEPCKPLQAVYCSGSICANGFLCSCFCPRLHVSFPLSNQTHLSYTDFANFLCFWFTETSKLNEFVSSASAMKNTPLKLSYVYQCIGCDSFHLQPVGRSLPKVYAPRKFLTHSLCSANSVWYSSHFSQILLEISVGSLL